MTKGNYALVRIAYGSHSKLLGAEGVLDMIAKMVNKYSVELM
jgi:dihydroxyacetone kinase DhaKLM complex PTS-EIIA-like component DhaM